MPVHMMLAGAAVFGLVAVAPVAAVRLGEWREQAGILARITPPTDYDALAEDAAVFAAEVRDALRRDGLRIEQRIDQHGAVHYRTVPQTAERARVTVAHLVDTQPQAAVSMTRPVLPTAMVPSVPLRGELRRARFYDVGRAG